MAEKSELVNAASTASPVATAPPANVNARSSVTY
jgi:hypothetical protein